jgi:hypothetical protein
VTVLAKIGWENAAGVTPDRFSNLSSITNTATMMKREYGPKTWIGNYATAIEIQNANEFVATWYLPLMLEGSTHSWINNLPNGIINYWEDMRTFTQKK